MRLFLDLHGKKTKNWRAKICVQFPDVRQFIDTIRAD